MPLDQPLLRLDKSSQLPWERRPDGRYWTHITLGTAGQKLDYYGIQNGQLFKRTEVVTKRGLLRDDSIKTLAQLPILLTHPQQKRFRLNREGLKIGQLTGRVARADTVDSVDTLIAEAFIDDYRGVELLDQMLADGQKPEASPCYDVVDIIRMDSTASDGIVLFEQIRGPYDHIAAPLRQDEGRGGGGIRLHCDRADELEMIGVSTHLFDEPGAKLFFFGDTQRSDSIVSETTTMTTQTYPFTLDGSNFSTADQPLANHAGNVDRTLTTLRSDMANRDQTIAQLQTQLGQAQAELGQVKAERDQLQLRSDQAQSPQAMQKQMAEHLGLLMKAIPIIQGVNPQFRADSKFLELTPFEVMQAAVIAAQPSQGDTIKSYRADSAENVGALKWIFNYVSENAGKQQQQQTPGVTANTRLDSVLEMITTGRGNADPGADQTSVLTTDGTIRSDAGSIGEIDGGQAEIDRIQGNNVGAQNN